MKSQLKFKPQLIFEHNEPSLAAGVYYLLLLLFLVLSGCSTLNFLTKKEKKDNLSGNAYQEMSSKDFADHLSSLKNSFLATPGVKTVTLDGVTLKYLNSLLTDIIGKNEIFFKELKIGYITILNLEAPLHFSLPLGKIFLSKGLIAKYIKHESMLVSVLSYELVRSEKMLYPKESFIPVGFLPLERMITFNRLSLEEKMEVHKWAYHITVRSGYDGEYYLSWLQTQNRNTADFIMQTGDANQITREESLFKAFLIKTSVEDNVISKKSSSRGFYTFLNRIRDGIL